MEPKQIAINFLQEIVKGNFDYAYDTYVDMKGTHHNVYTKSGFAQLKQGMQENDAKFPNKIFEIKKVFADANMVATHSHVKMGEQDISVVHMFRIKNEKIVEMWDCGQALPKDAINKDGAF
ncbi:MAG TPA: ester cyclase [Acidobacteriota bacterium]|nr:ester cyclase [Acidobacteriota bacterium]